MAVGSNIDVYVVGTLGEDDELGVFHDFAGVLLHLSLGRKDEEGGTMSDMIFGQGRSI